MALSYHAFHLNLLKVAYNNLLQHSPFDAPQEGSPEEEFLSRFQQLITGMEEEKTDLGLGQELLGRIPVTYTELVPLIPRDLFWFFGGDCLHFMPDEEIATYQQLDEIRFEAEESGDAEFNYENARARLLGLH